MNAIFTKLLRRNFHSSVYMVSSYRTVSTHIKRTAVRGHYVNYGL